ncbi:hypothetical protein Hanom_Chr15g01410891 [Helianthus anomalus]
MRIGSSSHLLQLDVADGDTDRTERKEAVIAWISPKLILPHISNEFLGFKKGRIQFDEISLLERFIKA